MRVLMILGTRPEVVKLAPVLREMRARPGFQVRLCVTAQHRQMLDQTLSAFSLVPDFDLDVMREGQDLFGLTARCMEALGHLFRNECAVWRPDWVFVQGDTTTTLAGALAAFYARIPVAHVEAGLRTGDLERPYPEEMNRRLVSQLSALHFAPTEAARQNLLRDGVSDSAIHVTGNTVIDALLAVRAAGVPEWPVAEGRRMILVTGHRRESFGEGFHQICKALDRIARRPDIEIVYPVHLNPNVRGPVHAILGGQSNIRLLEPLGYLPFIGLMDAASIILTDSGGIQEEAPSLGKPVLIMRDCTERPEGVEAGVAKLVGADANGIVESVTELLDHPAAYQRMVSATNPFGDGRASSRIVNILAARATGS